MRSLWMTSVVVLFIACGGGAGQEQEVSGPVDSLTDAGLDITDRQEVASETEVDAPHDLISDLQDLLQDSPPLVDIAGSQDAEVMEPDAQDAEEVDLAFDGPCDFGPLNAGMAASPSGTWQVGGFLVEAGPHKLDVTNEDDPERVIFSAYGASFLALGKGALEVEEHQGSFDVQAEIDDQCTHPIIQGAVAAESRLALYGGFTDEGCGELQFEIRLCQPLDGHLRFQVLPGIAAYDAISLRVESVYEERIFGLGEQFAHDSLDLNGRVIPVLAQEGGVGRGHGVISPAVELASPGSAGSQDSTYYAAPHYLTDMNRSLFLENTEYAVFDFSKPWYNEIRLFAPEMTGRILYGDSPLELIARFTEYAGRMPAPPAWLHEGAVVALARPLDESQAILDDLLGHGAEIAAVWNQTWSGVAETFIGEQVLWNWVKNPNHHPEWDPFVKSMNDQGIRVLCYVNSMFRDVPKDEFQVSRNLYQEAIEGGYFIHDDQDDPYLIEATAFEVGLLDLTNPDARQWMKDVLKEEVVESAGCDGWMADFAEAMPFDAVLHSGEDPAAFHNAYPVEWARLNREVVEELDMMGELLVFNRSGHTRTPTYGMLLWEGDQLTTWDKYDGLRSALHGLLNGGFSGVALNHSDTGGYTSLSQWGLGYSREAELLKRWTEMNAFTAVLRTHEGNQPGANAQVYSDDEAMTHFARFTRVYKALAFYRSQLFEEAAAKGWPVVRHLAMHHPGDPQAWEVHDQFLLGSEILVAPILDKCWNPFGCDYNRSIYLPKGVWIHLWTGQEHGSPFEPTTTTIQAPIGEPAVFYRKGSPIKDQLLENLAGAGVL